MSINYNNIQHENESLSRAARMAETLKLYYFQLSHSEKRNKVVIIVRNLITKRVIYKQECRISRVSELLDKLGSYYKKSESKYSKTLVNFLKTVNHEK